MSSTARRFLVIAALLAPAPLLAQTATQDVRADIRAINAIEIQGATVTLPPRHAESAPIVSKTTASYAITTNEVNRRIMVSIDSPMPEGTMLTMKMAAPTGGQAVDAVALSIAPQTAVTGISRLNETGLAIEYSITTTPGSRVNKTATRTVSLTLVSGV